MRAEIQKIKIKIDKKEIDLSLEEARELKQLLEDLFGKVEYIPMPYPQPVYPYRYWVTYTSGTDVTCTLTTN